MNARAWTPLVPWAAAAAVIAMGIATGQAALSSSLPGAPDLAVVIADVLAGWSFGIVGAVIWVRYPQSWVGALTVGVGFASFLADLRWFETDLTWTAGWVLTDIHLVVLAWLILAFPTGRLGRGERRFVAAVAVYFVVLAIAGHLFEDPAPGCADCPTSLLLVRAAPATNDLIWGVGQIANLFVLGVLVMLIIRKWTRSSPAARRGLGPVIWALGPIGVTLALAFVEPLIDLGGAGADAVLIAERLALVVFPVALGVGMLRTRFDQARAAELAARLDRVQPGELEGLIATTLGDPSARLGLWSDAGGFIDSRGRAFRPDSHLVMAEIHSAEGERLGAIFHDPMVDPSVVGSVVGTVTLALRNERLQAELRRQLGELEASRGRIAEAAMVERRRIERDLHDGAQQGLLALGASLGSIRSGADAETAGRLDDAIDALKHIIEDLRELARGVHPPILTERGLRPAIEALAERSRVPVRLAVDPTRCRPAVEAAAYFLVAEALANADRHAGATLIDITGDCENGWLHVAVSDDGRGGASFDAGTGLQGLADRLRALGGEVRLASPLGGGTTVEGHLPCG